MQRRLQERNQSSMRQEYGLVTQQTEEEKAKTVRLDAEIEGLKRALDAPEPGATGAVIQTVLHSEQQRLNNLHKSFEVPGSRSLLL
jgi:hypothetical protein